MKVQKLIDLLGEYSAEAEVKLSRGHASLAGLVSESELREHSGGDLGDDPEVVYLIDDGDRARYAVLSAQVQLRLDELQAALQRHEMAARWGDHAALARVDAALAAAVEALA